MTNRIGMLRTAALGAAALWLAACGDSGGGGKDLTACLNGGGSGAANAADSRVTILNNNEALNELIECKDEKVQVDDPDGSGSLLAPGGDDRWAKKTSFKLTLVAEAAPPQIVGAPFCVGCGLDDLSSGGDYTGSTQNPPYRAYVVEIDGDGTPDTFQWSDDGGNTFEQTGVAITGAEQSLNRGVTITFAATDGHTLADSWTIYAGTLQANSVAIQGNYAIVGYNMIGAPYLGGVQVYQLTGKSAKLKSQALFHDFDVNAVSASEIAVYAAGAREGTPAGALGELILSGFRLTLPLSEIELHSFAGTSVEYRGAAGKIYVTDGNEGGLSVVDDITFLEDAGDYTALDDARWVERDGTTAVVVEGCCGAVDNGNGQISVFNIALGAPTLVNSFPFTGADVPEAKSTVEVVGSKAVIAAGSGGVVVMNTNNGNVLDTIPLPTGTGLDDDVIVANAASVAGDLIFVSNGEAGVYVAQNDDGDLDASGAGGAVDMNLLGQLQFGSLESVNHVEYNGSHLFVAAGLGGLKIVKVDN